MQSQCSLGAFVVCPVSFSTQLAEVVLHITVLFWTQPSCVHRYHTTCVHRYLFFRSLPGACLQVQYAGLIVLVLAGVLSRVMSTNKQGDRGLYLPHDGSHEGDLRSFGSMRRARVWLWWFRCSLASCFTTTRILSTYQSKRETKSISKIRIILRMEPNTHL